MFEWMEWLFLIEHHHRNPFRKQIVQAFFLDSCSVRTFFGTYFDRMELHFFAAIKLSSPIDIRLNSFRPGFESIRFVFVNVAYAGTLHFIAGER